MFAIKYHNLKIKIADVTYSQTNFIEVDDYAYFLSDSKWQELYKLILQEHFDNLEVDLTKPQTKSQLSQLYFTIDKSLKEFKETLLRQKFLKGSKDKLVGRTDRLLELSTILYDIIAINTDLYSRSLSYVIQDRVLNALLRKELTSDFAFEDKETYFNAIFGRVIINTYYATLTNLNVFSNKKDTISLSYTYLTHYETLWFELFHIYNKNQARNASNKDMEEVITFLDKHFQIIIPNIYEILFCYFLY